MLYTATIKKCKTPLGYVWNVELGGMLLYIVTRKKM
jgi:hypothetical protein